MRAACAILVVLGAACGRVGFDARPVAASADASGDAIVVTGDGSVAGCGYVDCGTGTGLVACCVNLSTSCVAAAACTGAVYACGPCGKMERCCDNGPDLGTYCLVDNAACSPL